MPGEIEDLARHDCIATRTSDGVAAELCHREVHWLVSVSKSGVARQRASLLDVRRALLTSLGARAAEPSQEWLQLGSAPTRGLSSSKMSAFWRSPAQTLKLVRLA